MGKDIREDIAWAQINKDVLKSLENPKKIVLGHPVDCDRDGGSCGRL